jgi:hypothetical protein
MEYKPEDFEPLLAEFKEPKRGDKVTPYIAFGHYLREYSKGEKKIVPHIYVLNMAGAHAQKEQLEYYVLQKRFRVLKWHLPEDLKTPDGHTPYAELNKMAQIYQMAGGAGELLKRTKDLEQENIGLKAAIAEQKERLSKGDKSK